MNAHYYLRGEGSALVEDLIERGEPIMTSDYHLDGNMAMTWACWKIEESAKILANGVTTYEVEVEKGEKSFDLFFDDNGKLLKKTQKEKKEDKGQ